MPAETIIIPWTDDDVPVHDDVPSGWGFRAADGDQTEQRALLIELPRRMWDALERAVDIANRAGATHHAPRGEGMVGKYLGAHPAVMAAMDEALGDAELAARHAVADTLAHEASHMSARAAALRNEAAAVLGGAGLTPPPLHP